eukprot:TRINITY_DN8079_c0_g1_i3.p1 TRINITY_DN8079_c0_g1~~TRINITY_DN8079_c0_g1_i3.p1  ORF type:complete len:531 (-),score=146.74 TRINITY_DN8079_c0_g1_i3:689-2281(-)
MRALITHLLEEFRNTGGNMVLNKDDVARVMLVFTKVDLPEEMSAVLALTEDPPSLQIHGCHPGHGVCAVVNRSHEAAVKKVPITAALDAEAHFFASAAAAPLRARGVAAGRTSLVSTLRSLLAEYAARSIPALASALVARRTSLERRLGRLGGGKDSAETSPENRLARLQRAFVREAKCGYEGGWDAEMSGGGGGIGGARVRDVATKQLWRALESVTLDTSSTGFQKVTESNGTGWDNAVLSAESVAGAYVKRQLRPLLLRPCIGAAEAAQQAVDALLEEAAHRSLAEYPRLQARVLEWCHALTHRLLVELRADIELFVSSAESFVYTKEYPLYEEVLQAQAECWLSGEGVFPPPWSDADGGGSGVRAEEEPQQPPAKKRRKVDDTAQRTLVECSECHATFQTQDDYEAHAKQNHTRWLLFGTSSRAIRRSGAACERARAVASAARACFVIARGDFVQFVPKLILHRLCCRVAVDDYTLLQQPLSALTADAASLLQQPPEVVAAMKKAKVELAEVVEALTVLQRSPLPHS